MRKLLLTTTALVAAGTISSVAAAADFNISGNYKWSYDEMDRGISTTGQSGNRMYSEQNVTISVTNKTD